MPRACSQCGCTEIDTDPARGDAVCTNCGTVLEEQIIVSEVQYQESGAGGASVIGQFVSNDGTRAQTFRGPYGHGVSEDSRKLTLENGYKRLKEMGGKLNMHQSSIDTAFGFFKLAVAQKFTRGRKMEYILASCLYLVCRVDPGGSEDLELMLIDFSDMVQVNVHVLGRTFVQLAAELCQNIRIVDPIIYIRRFANQLHFGNKLNKIVESASRLVARMKRDWMHTGRRPAGLCGAALLISARMHNFNRTIDQIIKVVKVCESTVRKRLLEFDSTPSAQLTIEEFDNVDLEEEQDPPCFTEGKRKAKLAQLNEGKIPESTIKDLNKIQENINKSLKKKSMPVKADDEDANFTDPDKTVKVLDEEIVREAAGKDWKPGEWEGLGEDQCPTAKAVISVAPARSKADDWNNPSKVSGLSTTSDEEEDDDEDEDKKDVKKQLVTKAEDGELDLEGIDDDEIDMLIHTEEEYHHKAKWFEAEFGDFMETVKEREEKRRQKEEAAAKKKEKTPRTKKKKRKGGYDLESELAECMQLLKRDIKEKKYSDKIDYSVLKSLDSEAVTTEPPSEPTDITAVESKGGKELEPKIINRFRKSSISESQVEKKPLARKRVRIPEPVQVSAVKKAKIEDQVTEIAAVIEEDTTAQLPVEEPNTEDVLDEEEEDYFEDDEDEAEEKIVSARQLLGQDVSAYDEEDDYYY